MKQYAFSRATARIWGDREYPQLRGIARFYQRSDGVLMEVAVSGLPETQSGFFGLHIHEGGNCFGEGFPNTGGHYDPSKRPHPSHRGDLPPLLGDHGRAYMKVFSRRFDLDEIVGKTIIIHDGADDFHTQPSGNAGAKIACGVIRRG